MKINLFKRVQSALWNQRGESYVDTGVKMLIAIVIGALLLTGIYAITRDVVLESVESQISDFFDQAPTLDGVGGGSGNGGSGGGNEPPVLAATFADNSWDDIAYACQNDMVPDTWNVGDTKPMTINGTEIDIMIIGKNHDEYADGGIAPLTFMTKQVIENRAMSSSGSNAGGWDGSEMYAYLNGEVLDGLECKNSIKPVKKVTNIGGADAGGTATTTEVSNDMIFLLSRIEVDSAQTYGPFEFEGQPYEFFTDKEFRKLYDLNYAISPWLLRSPVYNNHSSFSRVNIYGSVDGEHANGVSGVVFGFCF